MNLKFKDIEEDFGIVMDKIVADHAANGETDVPFGKLCREVYYQLTKAYIEADKVDQLIDYLIDQWDAGGGEDYLNMVSEELIRRKDTARLLGMWNAVIAGLKASGLKRQALLSMQHFLNALEKLGDDENFERAKAEMDFYASGKKNAPVETDRRRMTEKLFWELIEKAKTESCHYNERPLKLAEVLERFRPSEIERFARIFDSKLRDSYRWELWGVAYLAMGGCSDDGFEYFRAWVISEGCEFYAALMSDPDFIAGFNVRPAMLETLLSAASECYERKTGNCLVINVLPIGTPTGEEWPEDQHELEKRFPRTGKTFSRGRFH